MSSSVESGRAYHGPSVQGVHNSGSLGGRKRDQKGWGRVKAIAILVGRTVSLVHLVGPEEDNPNFSSIRVVPPARTPCSQNRDTHPFCFSSQTTISPLYLIRYDSQKVIVRVTDHSYFMIMPRGFLRQRGGVWLLGKDDDYLHSREHFNIPLASKPPYSTTLKLTCMATPTRFRVSASWQVAPSWTLKLVIRGLKEKRSAFSFSSEVPQPE